MQGWIKINREIVNHWLWSDAERLKWWLDLLLMANEKDENVMHDSHLFVLQRGQMIASVAFLCKRWKKSNKTIVAFLHTLENLHIIKRVTLHRQTAIIMICNYDDYMPQESSDVHTILHTIEHTLPPKKETEEKESSPHTPYKEKEEKEKTPLRTILSRTREENFLSELENSVFYIEGMAMRYHIGTDEVREALQVFSKECSLKDTEHRTLTDYKRHFHDWLRYQVEKKSKQNDNGDDYRRAQQSNREQRARETEAAIDALLRAGARQT